MIFSWGKPVEDAVRDHPDALDQHLLVPAEPGPAEDEVLVLLRVLRPRGAVVGPEDLVGRVAGMQVDRHIESLRPRQHGLEVGMIQVPPRDVPVGQGAQEAVCPDRALQLVGGRLRALQGQGRETLQAARIVGHGPRHDLTVEAVGEVDALLPGDVMHGRRVRREDLNVESPLVHVADAASAQIRETDLLQERPVVLVDGVELQQFGSREGLLDSDELQVLVTERDILVTPRAFRVRLVVVA